MIKKSLTQQTIGVFMELQELLHPIKELIGPVTSKRLFTGHGIFKDNNIFILYEGEKAYLHATGELVDILYKLGSRRYQKGDYLIKPDQALYNYYELSDRIIQNSKLFKKLMQVSIAHIEDAKLKEKLLKKNRIKELINLSIKHERLLMKADIYTVEEFKEIGAYNAYVRLRKLGIDASFELFLALYSALKNINMYTLSAQEKERLLRKLNDILEANGLKKLKVKF